MTDPVIRSRIHYQEHTGVITHETTQPTEDVILERNSELRKNPGVIRDLGAGSGDTWGRQVATIPMILFEKAIRKGYDLNSKDSEHAGKELHRFLQSDMGKVCLVQPNTTRTK